MTRKPQPWYASLNLPAWIPQHGRNRKPHPPTHSDPTDRTSDSARAGDPVDPLTFANWAMRTFHPIEPQPPAIPYAGVRAGEIIGYRMWIVTQHYELCSLAHLFIWDPEAVIKGDIDKIVVDRFPFNSPIYGGTYSFASFKELLPELDGIDRWTLPTPIMFNNSFGIMALGVAIGTIKCWGEVVEHEKGYRAQYAKLQSIDQVVGPIDIDLLKARYKL